MSRNMSEVPGTELAIQVEQLKEVAYKDSLTGLLNRGAGERYITDILDKMSSDENCILMIVDIDNFKQVNDTLGHIAGDKVLCRVANALSGIFRANDIVARLGGDEFIVFLYGAVTKKLAQAKAKLICDNLQLAVGNCDKVGVSVSVGIYFSKGPCESFDVLYRMADAALYQAKDNGKNQFFLNDNIPQNNNILADTVSEDEINVIKFNRLINHIDSGIALVSMEKDRAFIYAGPSLCQMLGVDEKSIVGISIFDFVHPEDLDELKTMLSSCGENNKTSLQVRFRSAKGVWVHNRVNIVKIDYSSEQQGLFLNIYNISDFIKNKKALEEKNDRLQMALGQINQSVWMVNLATKRFTVLGKKNSFFPEGDISMVFPEELISSGWVHPESADKFMRFAEEMFNGRSMGYGNFLIRINGVEEYTWNTLSYDTQYDSNGSPIKVVGVVEKMNTDLKSEQTFLVEKDALPDSLVENAVIFLEANVTQKNIRRFWLEGEELVEDGKLQDLSFFTETEKSRIYDINEQEKFIKFFSEDNLLDLYENKNNWSFYEYKRVDSSGYIQWVSISVNVYKKLMSNDLFANVWVNSCSERHKWDVACSDIAKRDKQYSLYQQDSFKAFVERIPKRSPCALVMIKINGLYKIYDKDSKSCEKSRSYISSMLSFIMGTNCVGTSYDKDVLMYFFPNISSKGFLRENLKKVFIYGRFLIEDLMPTDFLSFFAGVTCVIGDEFDYDSLIESTINICDIYGNSREDKIMFYSAESNSPPANDKSDHIIDKAEMERPLNQVEKNVAYECFSDMLLANTLGKSLMSVFSNLGEHYKADRIYKLSIVENGSSINVIYEWLASGVESIKFSMSGLRVSKFPILQRCIKEKKPIYISTAKIYRNIPGDSQKRIWNFSIFPILAYGDTNIPTDFICLENAKQHEYDTALIGTMIPYIKNECIKYGLINNHNPVRDKHKYDALPNLQAYVSAIQDINSKIYSTLGVIYVNIPDLSIINNHNGFEYGSRLLQYVTELLIEVFGSKLLYRTWDNDFLVLCPNIVEDVIIGKYTWLRSILSRRYGKEVSVSYRWTDGEFEGKELVDSVKNDALGKKLTNERLVRKSYIKNRMQGFRREISTEYEYNLFLQPKFNIKTNVLIGAEVLVRAIGEDGVLIYPENFIKYMEHTRAIKKLDLYVLDQTLRLMEEWAKNNVKEIPLSINFSGVTMLEPTILASYLAIRSRYTGVIDRTIEIEIGQNIYTAYYDKLNAVIEQFKEFNAIFTVDDLGLGKDDISILQRVAFDKAKIDTSVIANISGNHSSKELVKNIINTCREKSIDCIAEGVEYREQASTLKDLGCDYAQGYYYEKPMSVKAFEDKYLYNLEEMEVTK